MSVQCDQIRQIIDTHGGHQTAHEIFLEARQALPKISIGTVYRNLEKLCAEGSIREVPLPDAPSLYEKMQAPHAHLICVQCGAVTDVPLPSTEKLSEQLKTQVLSCHCYYTHICEACRQNSQSDDTVKTDQIN